MRRLQPNVDDFVERRKTIDRPGNSSEMLTAAATITLVNRSEFSFRTGATKKMVFREVDYRNGHRRGGKTVGFL